MAAHLGKGAKKVNYQASSATREPLWIKWTLLTLAFSFFLLFLVEISVNLVCKILYTIYSIYGKYFLLITGKMKK